MKYVTSMQDSPCYWQKQIGEKYWYFWAEKCQFPVSKQGDQGKLEGKLDLEKPEGGQKINQTDIYVRLLQTERTFEQRKHCILSEKFEEQQ